MYMRVFVYVMTHPGDPDQNGVWGCNDCMGEKRGWNYDAVIGVGGVQFKGFSGKVKWIGIGPQKHASSDKRGPEVTFDYFCDDAVIESQIIPEVLARRIRKAPRGFMRLTEEESRAAKKILGLANTSTRSTALSISSVERDAGKGRGPSLPCVPKQPATGCSRRRAMPC
jgi:hypothetical protein